MSMSDTPMSDLRIDSEMRRPARMNGLLPRAETPIVPKNSIAGRALVAVVAIMTFLSSLTVGAVMLVLFLPRSGRDLFRWHNVPSQVVRGVHVGFLILLTFGLIGNFTAKTHLGRTIAWAVGGVGFLCGLYQWIFYADLIARDGDPTRLDLVVGTVLATFGAFLFYIFRRSALLAAAAEKSQEQISNLY